MSDGRSVRSGMSRKSSLMSSSSQKRVEMTAKAARLQTELRFCDIEAAKAA